MATSKARIISKAIELLEGRQEGLRYSELVRKIQQAFPEIPTNTIHGTVWNLDVREPDQVYKAARGLFKHTSFRDTQTGEVTSIPSLVLEKAREEDFYKPFADWLVKELEECTKAIPLGGNRFKDKWGTPDVIGIHEPRKSDIIRPATEIVSAEIKIDTLNLITAFGQACSYKLFSHKSYIVIPKNSAEEDIARIDALSLIFGIGLILFDSSDSKLPRFEIRVRPSKHEPDMFYVNRFMKLIEDELFS